MLLCHFINATVVDKHPVHRSQTVKQWLVEHKSQIELVPLPSYSPELNPAEYLNCDVKQGLHSKPPIRNLMQLKDRVRKYFQHPFIIYAA